ncbi:MAG: hypothetical protein IK062_01445 [Selenomonadaceae bacterium]|nr:hypothetical protein [Selenomonadaceae bacterium]
MRKIKVNKKDLEKKNKKITKMVEELFYHYTTTHDEAKMFELAEKILSLKPTEAFAVEKVSSVYIDHQKKDEADKAVTYMEEHFPPSPYRLFLRSRVCDLKDDYGGCIKYSEQALQMKDIPMLTRMMIHNILGHAYRYVGDGINSLKHYDLSSKMDLSHVTEAEGRTQCEKIQREDYSNLLFSLHNVNVSREKLFEEICGVNRIFKDVVPFTHSPETHPRHKKIRLGYISPDIRRHVVIFFSYAFFKSYDKSRFEVYIYAKNKEDRIAEEFKRGVDGFRNVLFDTPQVAAQKIKDDEIDILIDLSGHTANNCMPIMAYKPAPIQISAVGWFNTTGMPSIDYFMVDKYTDPVGMNEKFFSEKLLRLQHSHFCYMWHDNPTVISPAPCTKNGFVTFVSFNTLTKVTDEAFRTWAKIVNAVPNSKLYLKGKSFRDQFGTDYILNRIEAAGLSKDRVIYEPDEQEYLQKYANADIALDTFPYPGGGTTCDALYMGVPVITYVSTERHNTRFGYSLLTNVGLGELCAFSEEEYIQKAVDLANDWDRIREYHLTLRRQMEASPLMNDVIYMGEVEQDYEKIFNAWLNSEELPEFPQEPDPITEELAEYYYSRAEEYLKFEEENPSVNPALSVNIKRALYYFELAAQADKKHEAEIYFNIADCRKNLLNYAGAYESVCQCGKIIYESGKNLDEFSNKFLQKYHDLRGKLSLFSGNPVESADNYDKAVQFADENSKFAPASAALVSLNFLDMSSEDTIEPHFEYQKLLENIQPFTEYHERGEKIRVGYISAGFCQNELFTALFGMITTQNKEKFDVYCYSLNKRDDQYTNVFRAQVQNFVNVRNLSYFELAKKIHDDKIDILVDLAGHTEGNMLPTLAYKPAPIQISGLGYTETTGMKSVDYFITDEVVDPPGEHEKYFTEKLLYMPCQFSYAQRTDVKTPQAAPCTQRDHVTFGTICDYHKINDEMLLVWKEILNRVPKSVLMMRAQEFASASTINHAYARMKKLGFNMDQITFLPPVPNYLDEMLNLDLILDSYPCGIGINTIDAIYMGVPVITLYSDRRSTRFGLSILKSADVENLAVNNVQDYIERAVALVNDKEALDALHKNLRALMQKSSALNPENYTKILESHFEKILETEPNFLTALGK